jgi:hypothetical protein
LAGCDIIELLTGDRNAQCFPVFGDCTFRNLQRVRATGGSTLDWSQRFRFQHADFDGGAIAAFPVNSDFHSKPNPGNADARLSFGEGDDG